MDRIDNRHKPSKNEQELKRSTGTHGMVASAVHEATEIGAKVLRQGGNAMDALAAVQFALGVVEVFNTGIGASGFLVYYDQQTKKTSVINGHSLTPAGADKEQFLDEEGEVIPYFQQSIDAKSVGIPGIMKAMDVGLKEFGTKPLAELIEPAAILAEKGFRVNWQWDEVIEMLHLRLGDEAKKLFMPKGVPLVEGDWVENKDLAKTLRILLQRGIEALYEGEIADAIIDTLKKQGGIMTKEDLKNYQAPIEEAIMGTYRGYEIAVPGPPNGGGIALLQLLGILEGFELEKYSPSSWEKYYLLAEAMRLAFSDKLAYMSDPNFAEIPVEGLLNKDYIKERRKKIDWISRNPEIDCGNPWKYQGSDRPKGQVKVFQTGKDTTHFTVADRWGNVAACTSSNEHIMGSGIMVPGYGFLLNNDLTDFTPEPDHINSLAPKKQPVSAKVPTIVFKDGKPLLTLGSPGGPTIVASVAQVITHILDYGMDIKDAIEEPRIYNSMGPNIWSEEGIGQKEIDKLREMGFEFDDTERPIGNVQAILMDHQKGILHGAADSSRPGSAIGINER
ncbi:gamma-glutamyltransferase [Bacillus sp. ISL-47]|uniref:gamma-glutamyltransferase n=1 Tax=Bacillus sp. ISL-47 TaxID=2819130 RepID=UPI001BEB90F0|nr:gamma-glutamyltransferase [Bacillus sp. ISL-47]MBT2687748.1 gamma-glutamyltransferase [Bacillus sp. ISL-47]